MATLNLTTATQLDNAIPEWWEKKLVEDAARKGFWSKFEGKQGSGMPIIKKADFEKKPGDTIHFQTLSQLGGDGVTGSSTLEGNEEQLSLGQYDLSVDWLRHAVAITERGSKRANFDTAMAANSVLSSWMARRIDSDLFEYLIDTESPDTLYANDATSTATLGTNDTFGSTELDRMRLALFRKGAIPIRLVKKGNQEIPIYGVVISEMDEYNLSADTVWVESMQRIPPRSLEDHPLVLMSIGMWRGMMVFIHRGISGYQGTPLRPEASIYGAHNNSVGTITVGENTNKDYTKFFPSSGTIQITDTDGSEEFVSYTGKTNNTFTGGSRGASYNGDAKDGAESYEGGELVTLYNHRSLQLGFGAEIACRGWGMHPKRIRQTHDYGFENGLGIAAVFGQKGVENSDGDLPNYVVMESYAANPSNTI